MKFRKDDRIRNYFAAGGAKADGSIGVVSNRANETRVVFPSRIDSKAEGTSSGPTVDQAVIVVVIAGCDRRACTRNARSRPEAASNLSLIHI